MSTLIRLAPATAALLFTLALRLDAQIDRITGKTFATRSEVLARHGMVCTSVPAGDAGRARHSETRRQRGRRGHRGERHARSDGTGLERRRRRSLRDRLQRERKQTLRTQRQRPFAARPELRPDESGAGEAEARDHSADRHVADQRARQRSTPGRSCTRNSGNCRSPTISRRRFIMPKKVFRSRN